MDTGMPWVDRHYSPDEIADLLGVSTDTIRDTFREMPGVLRIERPRANKLARPYVTLRIPESTFRNWYLSHSGGWCQEVQGVRRRVKKPLVGRDKGGVVALGGLDRGVTK